MRRADHDHRNNFHNGPRLKYDAALYTAADAPEEGSSQPLWDAMALFVEFKLSYGQDPFGGRDPSDALQAPEIKADPMDRKDEHMLLALEVLRNQHRTWLFSILVIGSDARIIRWDRSGLIVTEKFNYVEDPEKLCRFILAFTRASPAAQGYDPTVTVVKPGEAEYEMMDRMASDAEKLEVRDYAREFFKESIAPGQKRWKVSVPCARKQKRGSGRIDLLIGAMHVPCSDVIGRGTRVFVALKLNFSDDRESCPFVALKDTWTCDVIVQEGYIIRELNEAGVECVPTVRYHGDVWNDDEDKNSVQVTETDSLYAKLHARCAEHGNSFRRHVHYRVVEDEVCLPLAETKDNELELLRLCLDYLTGTWKSQRCTCLDVGLTCSHSS